VSGLSAAALARQLADALPAAGDLTPESFELVARVRDLVEAVVLTDATAAGRADAAARIAGVTESLLRTRRESVVRLVRHEDGRVEHLTQAGSGRLNPQAPPMTFVGLSPQPGPGEPPRAVEIRAECTLTAAHGGPPGRAHGGVVATMLDELLGVAAWAAGCSGMTAGLIVRYRAGTPYGVPLELTARWTGRDGRKSFAEGEIRANGVVTAEATGVFITERPSG
jgi:acyl-coenzyme A thioesterase PaaI-like protein